MSTPAEKIEDELKDDENEDKNLQVL